MKLLLFSFTLLTFCSCDNPSVYDFVVYKDSVTFIDKRANHKPLHFSIAADDVCWQIDSLISSKNYDRDSILVSIYSTLPDTTKQTYQQVNQCLVNTGVGTIRTLITIPKEIESLKKAK